MLILLNIIFIHWVADFVFQTHWQATNKSKNNTALTAHVATYSLIWIIPMSIIFNFNGYTLFGSVLVSIFFSIITFICHWVTDYFTSRLNTKLWNKGDIHNFFVSIGFDQVLHYTQLFLLYNWLSI